MTKFNFKSFIIGIIVGTISVSTVFASGGIKLASFNTNKVIFNDVELDLKESQMISIVKDGEENASNYMPVRAVLEQMGYNVEWDGEKGAVIISTKITAEINNNINKSDEKLPIVNKIKDSEINKDDYISIMDFAKILSKSGYGSVLLYKEQGVYNENYMEIYSPYPEHTLIVTIPTNKFIITDIGTYLEKSYFNNDLLPLLPLLDGKI